MFIHLAIHRPKPEHEADLVDSMHRFRDACRGKPGCRSIQALKADEPGVYVGLAIWDSKEDWDAALPAAREAVRDDPFDEWETAPIQSFVLREV